MRLFALIALLALCSVAARASAGPAPLVFRLTVAGTSKAEWDHTERRVGLCATIVRSEGFRIVRFASRRPTVVRFVGARLLRVDLRNLAGTVTLTGHETVTSDCGSSDTPCAKTTIRFATGAARLVATGVGRVTVVKPSAKLRRPDCPPQPADIVATPLGPAVGPLRISAKSIANTRIARITLTASASRHKIYGDPEEGTSEQHASWKLTFVRVAG